MTDVDLGFMTFECLFDSPIQISAMMLADRRSYWFRFPLLACPGFAQVVHVPSKALDARKLPRLPAFCNPGFGLYELVGLCQVQGLDHRLDGTCGTS